MPEVPTEVSRTDMVRHTRNQRARPRYLAPPPDSVHRFIVISKYRNGILAIVTGVCSQAVSASAQTVAPVSISGLAFDSLRNAPLAGATINLAGAGVSRSATSDPRGRFAFDSIVAGTYTLVMYHASLDSIGLAGISKAVIAKVAPESVQISTPSFATMWRAACGSAAAPGDSGFVFGAVREVEHDTPVSNAAISLSWLQLAVDTSRVREKSKDKHGGLSYSQQRWGGEVQSDARGNYAVCGVPTDVALQVSATSGTAVTGMLDLPPFDEHSRIRRQDLLLGVATTDSEKAKPTGVVAGRVVGVTGAPASGARVVVDGAAEVRSAGDGRFVVPRVPLGTREIEVLSVGAVPFVGAVDVTAKDTVTIDVNLQKVTSLDAVKVTARTAHELRYEAIQERLKLGLGHSLDSTRIGGHNSIVNAVSMIVNPKAVCALILDGVKYLGPDMGAELKFRSPGDIALIEAYRYTEAPMEYRDPRRCGRASDQYLLVWTKLNIR